MVKDKKVVGAMLVSRRADVLDITIPNLLKWCDWIMIMMDNESDEVREKVNEYAKKYFDRVFLRRSSIPHEMFERSGNTIGYHKRWKQSKGDIRDDVFVQIRRILDSGDKRFDHIDIFIFQDHDEIFTDYFPELLEEFIASGYNAISMKPIDVVGNMQTVRYESKSHHVYVMKYSRELAGLPRRFYAIYHPLSHDQLMRVQYYSVHLAYWGDEGRKWRAEHWKRDVALDCELWTVPQSVEHLSPEEIRAIFKQKPNEGLSN